jgi:hypothetical protein
MKRLSAGILFGLLSVASLWPFAESYHGPRALALGYASVAFSYDGNAMFINPAFLAAISSPLTGFQYDSSHRDFGDASDKLAELAALPLTDFQSLSPAQKVRAVELLRDIYASGTIMSGFHEKMPFMVTAGYGVAISSIEGASLTPVSATIPSGDAESISNDEIAALGLEYIGVDLKRYTIGYGLQLSSSMSFGIAAHYLHGKAIRFTQALTAAPFGADAEVRDYLEYGWDLAARKSSCVSFDAGLLVQMGQSFTLGVTARNLNRPSLKTDADPIRLGRRVIGGLAFRPSSHWGIYIDADIVAADLYGNGSKSQPVSMGVECGLFKSRFFLRAGLHNDLKEKHFFGSGSNPLFGCGLGFNLTRLLADIGLGLDSQGRLRNLALSLSLFLK